MLDISCCRLPIHFPMISQLLASIEALSVDGWIPHVNRACYDGFWDVYPLRGLAKYRDQSPILQAFALEESEYADDFADYSSLTESPELVAFLAQIGCPILSVRLMRMRPGTIIAPHRDYGLCFSQGQARLHLCLQTDPNVEFIIAGESVHMAEGELWYLNADLEHAVYHRGKVDRVHVVIDCVANDWLRNQLGLPEYQSLADMTLAQRQNWLAEITEQIIACPNLNRFCLRQPIRELATSSAKLTNIELHPGMFLDTDFTKTSCGKAVSMTTAAQCAEEFLRTATFIRGINQAIAERTGTTLPDLPVTVLYAGTGPFAILLLPLMLRYSSNQLQVTLIDIHQESINRLQQLIEAFELNDRVASIKCADATQWHSDQQFDLIISETMKAGLDTEPQVSIFAHLIPLLKPTGTLIPQKVELSVNGLDFQGARTPLSCKAQLDSATAVRINNGNQHALDMNVVLPERHNVEAIEVCTAIQVYEQHRLEECDCSLNVSLRIPLDLTEKFPPRDLDINGETAIQLAYTISSEPGYSLSVVSSNSHILSIEDEPI